MKKYLLVYRGAVKPDDGKQHMTEWMAWVHGLGDAMVDPGLPVCPAKTVSSTGVTNTDDANPISGISVLQAIDLNAALEMINNCPHINIGGSIEVSEAMTMPMA